MAHIGENEKLLRLRSPIHRVRSRNERVLNKSGQTLTFQVRRIGRNPLQEWQPGSEQASTASLSFGVVGLDAARYSLSGIIEMNADQNAFPDPVSHGGAFGQ